MAINRFDLMQGVLFSNLDKKSKLPSFEEEYLRTVLHPRSRKNTSQDARTPAQYFSAVTQTAPIPQVTPGKRMLVASGWNAWFSPVAGFERYDAKSENLDTATSATWGMVAGTTRHYQEFNLGFSGFFMRSSPSGGNWTADMETYGVMAGLETDKLRAGLLSPKVVLGIGYAYSEIQQKRDGVLGYNHKSFPGQHGLRLAAKVEQGVSLFDWLQLTPTTGLDYTLVTQSSYRENGRGLRLMVDGTSMQSIRPYMKGELHIKPADSITLTTHALVRHEAGDCAMPLTYRAPGASHSFSSDVYKYSRSSGSGGVRITWQPADGLEVSAHYDMLVGDRYPGHYAHAPAAMAFDGESYDGSSGNGGIAIKWRLADSVSLNATYDAVFDGDAPGTLMNAVVTWEF